MVAPILLVLLMCFQFTNPSQNIILILVDDLDTVLDGMTPLKYTVKLIGQEGAIFENAFVASPIGCPNRATILTGKYMHNHFVYNNSIEGNCSSLYWQQNLEFATFANILKLNTNYITFYAGKYLNMYGTENAGGTSHIPPGWDWWYGLVGDSKYYNYSLSINGTERKYGTEYNNYLTDVITYFAKQFILNQSKENKFLMVVAPPAPHAPFISANRHFYKFKDVKAKRTSNFNKLFHKERKHWLVRMEPNPLPMKVVKLLDDIQRKRWETLLAVDEMVLAIYEALVYKQLLEDTYIIFTSDNGYHIGQFGLTVDKRQPYETDIRVPFLIRGQGVEKTKITSPVGSVDIFATIMDIAGVEHPSDGVSVLRNLYKDRTFLIEYKGEGLNSTPLVGCPRDNDPNLSFCSSSFACKCFDSINNTYRCIRRFSKEHNNIFCAFDYEKNFFEMYDLNNDPDELNNTIFYTKGKKRNKFRKRLNKLNKCKLSECNKLNY